MLEEIKRIDSLKSKLEADFQIRIKKVFSNMAKDAGALYKATGRLPTQSLASNYSPEFLKEIRDIYRKTIKEFGFEQRAKLKKSKNLDFEIEKKLLTFEYDIEHKQEAISSNQLEKVNNDFLLNSSLFVANESEEQVNFIEDTNTKELTDIEKVAIAAFFLNESRLINDINNLAIKINQLDSLSSEAIRDAKKKELQKQLDLANEELRKLRVNKNVFVGDKIEEEINKRAISRSDLIATQNVGNAESWARNEEAALLAATLSIQLTKEWSAILDGHTRINHATADGQKVPVNQKFIVGGYQADRPRDSSLPIEETANCRCVALYKNVLN